MEAKIQEMETKTQEMETKTMKMRMSETGSSLSYNDSTGVSPQYCTGGHIP